MEAKIFILYPGQKQNLPLQTIFQVFCYVTWQRDFFSPDNDSQFTYFNLKLFIKNLDK